MVEAPKSGSELLANLVREGGLREQPGEVDPNAETRPSLPPLFVVEERPEGLKGKKLAAWQKKQFDEVVVALDKAQWPEVWKAAREGGAIDAYREMIGTARETRKARELTEEKGKTDTTLAELRGEVKKVGKVAREVLEAEIERLRAISEEQAVGIEEQLRDAGVRNLKALEDKEAQQRERARGALDAVGVRLRPEEEMPTYKQRIWELQRWHEEKVAQKAGLDVAERGLEAAEESKAALMVAKALKGKVDKALGQNREEIAKLKREIRQRKNWLGHIPAELRPDFVGDTDTNLGRAFAGAVKAFKEIYGYEEGEVAPGEVVVEEEAVEAGGEKEQLDALETALREGRAAEAADGLLELAQKGDLSEEGQGRVVSMMTEVGKWDRAGLEVGLTEVEKNCLAGILSQKAFKKSRLGWDRRWFHVGVVARLLAKATSIKEPGEFDNFAVAVERLEKSVSGGWEQWRGYKKTRLKREGRVQAV